MDIGHSLTINIEWKVRDDMKTMGSMEVGEKGIIKVFQAKISGGQIPGVEREQQRSAGACVEIN